MEPLKADGVRRSVLDKLNGLVGYTMADGKTLDQVVLDLLVEVTQQTGREILIITDDHSTIHGVFMGDATTVSFGDAGLDTSAIGLNRHRVIHTHPGGSPYLSGEDCSSATRQKVQCMIAVGVDDHGLTRFGIGLPSVENEELIYRCGVVKSLKLLNQIDITGYAAVANRDLRNLPNAGFDIVDDTERAILLGIDLGNKTGITLEASMTELTRLVETAGGEVLEIITQNKDRIDPTFYMGKGKLGEIARLAQNSNANLIVTNDELNSNQIACIEEATGCKCIDRTTIILDIFARHAKTKEGILQVELAQQRYRLAHLKGLGKVLSRTGGGIGTRGPGEKKLETDRRHIHRQIDELRAKLERIDQTNALAAKQRKKNRVRTVALVGYTNSGKSTLFNHMTGAGVVMQDGLFITLDATMRQIDPAYGNYLMSDTVGFIEKLPHDLVTAFRTTLKEVEDADLLLHVVDAGNPDHENQMAVVDQVLNEIGSGHKDVLIVYNKIDNVDADQQAILNNKAERCGGVCISALNGVGIESLNEAILAHLNHAAQTLTFLIPYADSQAAAKLHTLADVLAEDYADTGTRIQIQANPDFPLHRFEQYLTEDPNEDL